jgi:ribosomal protein S27AE
MEKYGVDEGGEELEKKASAGCPQCGGKVEKHGNVLTCPKCGTEPFETKKG